MKTLLRVTWLTLSIIWCGAVMPGCDSGPQPVDPGTDEEAMQGESEVGEGLTAPPPIKPRT